MSYYFVGKFNHVLKGYADNELWTVLFPAGLKLNDPVVVTCQWTETHTGAKKQNEISKGKITKTEGNDGQPLTIEIFGSRNGPHYWYEGTINAQRDNISLTMRNPEYENSGSVNADIFNIL